MRSTGLFSKTVSLVVIALILNSTILYMPVVTAASDPEIFFSESQPDINGNMTGGGSIFNGSIRVTHGFELNCNASRMPNNLQVNWNMGRRFHLESLTSASCTDDPAINPNPPSAGFDTYEGRGTGSYNGVPGAQAHWIFTDAGEPGSRDSATIQIWDVNGNLILSVSGNLRGGNHQAHGQVSIINLVSINVAPADPTIALGQSQQFTAMGSYSDGSTRDLTSSAAWSSSNTSVAAISAAGLAASAAPGTAQITAASEGIISPAQTLTVTPAQLVSIAVTPVDPTIALGESLQFTATGTYTDGSMKNITTISTWSSSYHSAAIIAASGLATSVAEGTTDITAALGGITSPAQKLTVTVARLVSIAVSPVNPVIALGQTQQFIANGTYSDGSIRNITSIAAWKSNNSSAATISDTGLATSVSAGTTQVNATSDGISSPSQTLTVNLPYLYPLMLPR